MTNIVAKIFFGVKRYHGAMFLCICALLIAFIGLNLGKISSLNKTPVTINSSDTANISTKSIPSLSTKSAHTDPRVVVSKKATSRLYHFSWCSGAKRIKEENKLWFDTESAAISAGYSLAGNCSK